MRRVWLASIVAAVALVAIPSSASAASVLVYGPSDGLESTVATDAGHAVTVADEATWASMTTAQFAALDAIVFGDDEPCSAFTTAEDNRTTWSPAVSEGIVVGSFDPSAHDDGAGPNQTEELVNNSINFAVAGTRGGTGLSVSCAFEFGTPGTVTLLDQFGTFQFDGESRDTITILAPSHPVIVGPPTLTESGLDNWGQSAHSGFTTFPASFEVIALGENGSTEPVLIAKDPPPPHGICRGQTATVTGTEQDDVLTGTDERDVIAALGGNDQVRSLGGNDLVCGAAGKDVLRGGKNKDKLLGQAGKDKLRGQGGKDRLLGKGGKDKLNGGTAKDVCNGGKKDDTAKQCEVEKSI
jgi:Ca2+-binding RTX toxin-like protein